MKGILLAGGRGTRLYPTTKAISKHLIPIYDKPLIYYSLSVLMLAGIRDVVLITNPEHVDSFRKLLEDGSKFGINISYVVQEKPRGIADAFIVAEDLIKNDKVCLILGDNIFYGQGFSDYLKRARSFEKGAVVFAYPVKNPSQYGVVEFDDDGKVVSIEEKPTNPRSNYAVPGLYFHDEKVAEIAKSLKPSSRGELEITDLNRVYLEMGELKVIKLGRGMAWFDAGTPDRILEASEFVAAVQRRQGFYIAAVEEIAHRMGFIDSKQLLKLAHGIPNVDYRNYLLDIAKGDW